MFCNLLKMSPSPQKRINTLRKAFLTLTYLLLACPQGFCGQLLPRSDLILQSPQITNWGPWGELDECPKGTIASGMQLKIDRTEGYKINPAKRSGDATALTGIRLFCIPPGSNEFSYGISIISKYSSWGDWGKSHYCDKGVITGFQLRSHAYQGGGDDTAANNLRIFCSNLSPGGLLEGDGQSRGEWTQEQKCLSAQAVCGIKTQVETFFDGDNSSLNNIMMKCCDVPNLGKTCNPTDDWKTTLECDNTLGSQPLSCKYTKSRGITQSSSVSQSLLEELAVYSSLGFSMSAMYSGLSANFVYNLNVSSSTSYTWSKESSETWQEAVTTEAEFTVPGGMRSRLSQAVGSCGCFDVFSNYFRKEDFNASSSNVGTVVYFHLPIHSG